MPGLAPDVGSCTVPGRNPQVFFPVSIRQGHSPNQKQHTLMLPLHPGTQESKEGLLEEPIPAVWMPGVEWNTTLLEGRAAAPPTPECVQILKCNQPAGYRPTVWGRSWVCAATFGQTHLAETLKTMKFMHIRQLSVNPCFELRRAIDDLRTAANQLLTKCCFSTGSVDCHFNFSSIQLISMYSVQWLWYAKASLAITVTLSANPKWFSTMIWSFTPNLRVREQD